MSFRPRRQRLRNLHEVVVANEFGGSSPFAVFVPLSLALAFDEGVPVSGGGGSSGEAKFGFYTELTEAYI